MESNKFATMLHRKTNRITLVLVYAALEWALIFFLLLNSLFSYLIIKFAHYFGLKPPCLLCSRLDHILEPQNSKSSYRKLICEHHCIELSRSGYCCNHLKFLESHDMCKDCSSSHLHNHKHPSVVSAISVDDRMVAENDNVHLRCSCCGVHIKSYIFKPSSEVLEEKILCDFVEELDQTRVDSLGIKDEDRNANANDNSREIQTGPDSDLTNEDDSSQGFSFWLPKRSYSMVEAYEEERDAVLKEETKSFLKNCPTPTTGSYANEIILPQNIEFYIDLDDYQLVPVNLVNLEMKKSEHGSQLAGEEDQKQVDQAKSTQLLIETDEELVLDDFNNEDLPTEQGQGLEMKSEIDVEVELDETELMELSRKQGDEEEAKRKIGDALVLYSNKVEVETTRRYINFEFAGEQSHDVAVVAIDDQVLNATIPTADFGVVYHIENDETKVEDSPTKQGQDMGMKSEIVIEMEVDETKIEEVSNNKGVEEEMKMEVLDANGVEILPIPTIDGLQLHGVHIDDQVAEELELNANVPTSDNRDACHIEAEELPTKQAQELEVKELDGTQTKELSDDLQISGDQAHDAPLTAFDDEVTEETELIQLNANSAISDFGELCYTKNSKIDIVKSLESTNKIRAVEPFIPFCKEEECLSTNIIIRQASAACSGLLANGDCEPKQTGETNKYTRVEIAEHKLLGDLGLPHEPGELEGKKSPDSLQHSLKKTPFLQIIASADQETFERSAAKELRNVDGGVATVEELKAVLKSERSALRALSTELEEERNAAAVATNQTMLMISRLQEEKATIEMEALQYQRMMEEQSEYDQEALQLMNEILVKREKELQEVEKELEIYKKKVADYEERERMRSLSQRKDRTASCSIREGSDRLSVDLHDESREEDGLCGCEENGHHDDTLVDAIFNMQDSLSRFEEERLSILEQLKVLEEKLCTLAEEEEHESLNIKPFEQFNGENTDKFHRNCKANGDSNGINGRHHEKWRINGQKPKQLLPLFDAAECESDDEMSIGSKGGLDPVVVIPKAPPTMSELENKRLAIEEEVDDMYERLHGLEADREFIIHCIGSLRKGDRGVHLLQEILHHLHDLKNVELQARNLYSLC